ANTTTRRSRPKACSCLNHFSMRLARYATISEARPMPMRILLGEDDHDMLDITSYALRKYGFEVVGASDGTAVLERWRAEQPDVILLDVNLPGVSGMDVCRQIRSESSIPIVM